MPVWNKIDYPMDKVCEWVSQGYSKTKISKELGVDVRLIHKLCKKHNLICKKEVQKKGALSSRWKGGRIVDDAGYILLYCPEHPHARNPHKSYVLEHRYVMEKHLGRLLNSYEIVHHKNRDRKDNRIENLELFSSVADHLLNEWSEEERAHRRMLNLAMVDSRKALKLDGLKKQRKIVR